MELVTLAERPDLETSIWSLTALWPEFMLHDATADLYYAEVGTRWAGHTILAVDGGEVVARAFCVPFAMGPDLGRERLPDGGWDAVIRWAHEDVRAGRLPTTLSALEIAIVTEHRGRGLAPQLVDTMRSLAGRDGLDRLVAPVRPSRKHLEPEVPMGVYAARTRDDGLPEDPWLRVHARLGGRAVGVCPLSMTIAGTLEEWRAWTGLAFDTPGPTTVPGALAPVHADLAGGHAVYVEPNVWVSHEPIDPG